ncbi:AAA family ATPase [[Clostridium] innocuum]|nr:AAA family ATPase [[Clostridium] innocuum]MCR0273439.1 AAA family ATPase [[Clostridium] innocuum]
MRQVQEYYKTLGVSSQQLLYYNFESYEYVHLLDDQKLYTYRKDRIRNIKDSVYLFFDEIQNVKNWQRCINALQVDFLCDIYITGSNAKLLSGNWLLWAIPHGVALIWFLQQVHKSRSATDTFT